MMTPASLFDKLTGDAPLVALIAERVYWQQAPQRVTKPYVIWQRIASEPIKTHNEPTQNQFDLIQFSAFAATPEAADDIALAIITALDGQALSTGDVPTLQMRRDMGWQDAVSLYRSDLDFLV